MLICAKMAPARQSHEVQRRLSHLFWQTQVYHHTFHAPEGPHRGDPVKERANRARCLLSDACVHARRVEASSIPHGQRAAVPSETVASRRIRCVHGFRCRGSCVHTVKARVPLDSVLVWFAVRCLSFVSVVPHWHRGHVTVESSVRHCAAVDLERSGCEEKTWATV